MTTALKPPLFCANAWWWPKPRLQKRKIALTRDAVKPAAPQSQPQKAAQKPEETPAIEETPEGEKLNVVLAYEPADIKHLNSTTFDVYLVNDSNYYLYFTYLTRADESTGWTTRYAGIVEPNIRCSLKRSPEPTSLRWTASLYR